MYTFERMISQEEKCAYLFFFWRGRNFKCQAGTIPNFWQFCKGKRTWGGGITGAVRVWILLEASWRNLIILSKYHHVNTLILWVSNNCVTFSPKPITDLSQKPSATLQMVSPHHPTPQNGKPRAREQGFHMSSDWQTYCSSSFARWILQPFTEIIIKKTFTSNKLSGHMLINENSIFIREPSQ